MSFRNYSEFNSDEPSTREFHSIVMQSVYIVHRTIAAYK